MDFIISILIALVLSLVVYGIWHLLHELKIVRRAPDLDAAYGKCFGVVFIASIVVPFII